MSRVGKRPIVVPGDVKVSVDGRTVRVEGPNGELEREFHPLVQVRYDSENNAIAVCRGNDERQARALHGLTRALIQNMVQGVKDGFEKRLEIVGVGYLAAIQGDVLQLRVGFAHEVHKKIPQGLTVTCPDQTHVSVKGCDKQQVGQFAAEVRAVRKPEPYKGKGIRYAGEVVKIKPGKAAT
jgi:large subunit ribosomal protein L6